MYFLIGVTVALTVYVVLSGIVPLHCSLAFKAFLVLVVLAIACKYWVYTLGGGTLGIPNMSRRAMLVYEAAFGAFVCFIFFLLMKDSCTLILWLVEKFQGKTLPSLNTNAFIGACAALSVLMGAYGCHQAIKVPEVRQETIEIRDLPRQWRGTKVALLSDLHIGAVQGREWLSEIVEKTNAFNPEIVFIAGDFIDGSVQRLGPELEPLTHLKAKYGVYAIPGNHEYYYGYDSWMLFLKTLGITMLENESVAIDKGGAQLVIGGTTDPASARFGLEEPDLEKTFANAPQGALRILMTHQPKTPVGSGVSFDLQLSGHTHGGHMFFLYPLIALFNDGFVSGAYRLEDKTVYVSRGSGLWNGFSQRIGVPSEITEITLE